MAVLNKSLPRCIDIDSIKLVRTSASQLVAEDFEPVYILVVLCQLFPQ